MKEMTQKAIVITAAGAILLSGCSATPGTDDATAAKVAVLSEAAEGDPWADLVAAGAEQGADEATVKRIAGIQTTAIDQQIRSVASSGYNPVVVLQDNMAEAVVELAPAFPDTQFIVVDSFVENDAENVTTVTIDASDTAYLAGTVAALTSESPQIGFIGGAEVPIISQFLCGFESGVNAVEPTDTVTAVYAGTFTDPSAGQNLATQLYSDGVDVVFQAAALTGLGVLKAAELADKKAIGVDTWQGDVAPGAVVWSALKDGAGATAFAVAQALDGSLAAGSLVWDSTRGAKLYDERDFEALDPEQQQLVLDTVAALQDGTTTVACG